MVYMMIDIHDQNLKHIYSPTDIPFYNEINTSCHIQEQNQYLLLREIPGQTQKPQQLSLIDISVM